jgi:hypothetical protein
MRGLLLAALLVVTTCCSYELLDADDEVDTNGDECTFLAVRQTLAQRSTIGLHGSLERAAVAMQRVMTSFNNDPVSSAKWLHKVLGLQKSVLDNQDSDESQEKMALLASEVSARACAGDLGPCWRASQGQLQHQPKYPFEPLLDDDFIHNAGNWLDTWMMEKPKTTTAPPPPPKTNKTNATKLAWKGACFVRATEPIGNAKPGTKCLFGIVAEDEGSHCVFDHGKYGAFGWCFTDAETKEWGSCSETCPTAGNSKVLIAKINMLENHIVKLLRKLRKDTQENQAKSAD